MENGRVIVAKNCYAGDDNGHEKFIGSVPIST